MEVRLAQKEDARFIVDFQILMAQETEHLTLDRPTVEKGVEAVFDDASKGAYWVAESEGQVVGCLLTVPEWSDWRLRKIHRTFPARRPGALASNSEL